MSDRLSPGPDAKARIQKLSQKELQEFFAEVPAAGMRFVASVLPNVDGFRPGSPAGIVRQKEALARRLSRPTANDRDFHGLYVIWRTWIGETQANAPLIQELIDKLEDAADNAEGPDARRLAIEQQVDSLLQQLKDESQQNRCTRETIEKLFTFSPFPETPASRSIIASAKAAADVERDAKFHNLPSRLDQDENEIKAIKSDLHALTDRVASAARDAGQALDELPRLRAAIEEVSARIAAKEKSDPQWAPQTSVEALEKEVGALKDTLRGMASHGEQIAELSEAIELLGSSQKLATDDRQDGIGRMEALASSLDQLKRDVDALLEDRTQADRFAPLEKQLAELKQHLDGISATSLSSSEIKDSSSQKFVAASAEPQLRCVALGTNQQGTAINSHGALAAAFAKSLMVLGLRKSTAQIFAEECAAAVAARQVIFLQGAFAVRLARTLANVVGGPASSFLTLPIGIRDGEGIRQAVAQVRGRNPGGVDALAIEGINRTALEVTRDVILDFVDPSLRATESAGVRIAVFAALSRGVASLPVGSDYFELGPVFDLDYLDWRTNVQDTGRLDDSFLPIEVDNAIHNRIGEAGANVEEATRLGRALVKKRNPSIARVVVRAYQALHLMRSDVKAITPLQSLFFGWLVPYWAALHLSKEQVDSELDGGKVQGGPTDARLSAMFDAEFPNDDSGEKA